MSIDYRIGDVRDVMASIPDGSVSLVATSPPFLALRSYLPAGHEHKHAEIGSEANPAAFLDTLLALTAEWGRVLAPWGSIAIELGDTYSGSGMGPDAKCYTAANLDATGNGRRQPGPGWPLPKSLALIPQLYAVALAYGINPLTGQPSPAGRWRVRNVIVWHRPNPAVGALGDKYRPSTSYITVATRAKDRWFDLTAVRGEPSPNTHARLAKGVTVAPRNGKSADRDGNYDTMPELAQTAGAPPLDTWTDHHDTWTLTTQPSKLSHYAMWPAKLAERLILSMCPQSVCTVCGEARRRVERTLNSVGAGHRIGRHAPSVHSLGDRLLSSTEVPDATERETLGWTDCGHNAFAPGVVLDPFCGTGTTMCVAELHGRNSIGIDINPTNRQLLEPRMAEVKRALFGVAPELPGQLGLAL